MVNKQEKKLIKLNVKAQSCLTRKKAQKLIKKADKAHKKVFASDFWAPLIIIDDGETPGTTL